MSRALADVSEVVGKDFEDLPTPSSRCMISDPRDRSGYRGSSNSVAVHDFGPQFYSLALKGDARTTHPMIRLFGLPKWYVFGGSPRYQSESARRYSAIVTHRCDLPNQWSVAPTVIGATWAAHLQLEWGWNADPAVRAITVKVRQRVDWASRDGIESERLGGVSNYLMPE